MNRFGVGVLISVLAIIGCNQTMENQPRYEPYEEASHWPDNQSARMPVPGTVARGDELDPRAETLPLALTYKLLERGKHQYEVFCTPCHGLTGNGGGMVVQRGFPAPPSFHNERLRRVPLRHFYDVVSHGYGVMYAYGARVQPRDRWAIAAYIRALQLSQNGSEADLTTAQRARLKAPDDNNKSGNKENSQ